METTIEKTKEEILQEILQMDSAIKKAHEKMMALSQDKEFLREYHMREMAMSDWTTGVNTGIEKKLIEVAKNLLREGLSVEIIQRTTGLDMETIQSLDDATDFT
jgi:predicted transposase/invertase (TIGR01784 family)